MQTPDPVENEAQQQALVEATLAGRTWRVPADADLWPLSLILACPILDRFGGKAINYPALFSALELMLGEVEFQALMECCPKRRDLVKASNVLAAAAGFPSTTADDRVFGSLPTTIALLTKWPGKAEADLDRFWGRDYRDRFRFDRRGRRRLTLRQIHVRLQNLPAESSLAIALHRRSGSELLLMDVFKAIAGKDHPERPLTPEEAARAQQEQAGIKQAREEYRARQSRKTQQRSSAADTARRNRAAQLQREAAHA